MTDERLLRRTLRRGWDAGPTRRARRLAAYERRNGVLHDRHPARRAFVIGNGPSILEQPLTELAGEIVFVLNSFFYHPQLHAIRPTYLCSLDPALVDPAHRARWHEKHLEHDTRGITMLFHRSAARMDRRLGLFTEHDVHYLHAASPLVPALHRLSTCPTDLRRPLAGHGLVLTDIALPAALAMGVSEVYLLGFDAQPITSFEEYLNYNFYGQDPLYSLEAYRADYERFHVGGSHDSERAGLMELSAACLRRTAAQRGAEIFNATLRGGNLPGFPAVDLDVVLATSSA